MVEIETLANKLQRRTEWQRTPQVLYLEDYCELVCDALRQLFILTGRAAQFDEGKLTIEDEMPVRYDAVLRADELEWLLVEAEICFFRRVQQDVNNLIGYATDAMTITNADKPFVNLQNTLRDLEHRQRVLYYKMPQYTLL